MEVGFAFSGTKGRKGQGLILKRKLKEDLIETSHLFNDSRDYFNKEVISHNGDEYYSIKIASGYKILSKYRTIQDALERGTGYIASHLFIPIGYSISETARSLEVVENLLQTYIENYVSNNKIKDEIEDPYIFEDITDKISLTKDAAYEKSVDVSSTKRGHISFENKKDVSFYFDIPYRKVFLEYDEIILVERSRLNMLINLGQTISEPPKPKMYSLSFSPYDKQTGTLLKNATISLSVDGGISKKQNEVENLFEGQEVEVEVNATGYKMFDKIYIAGPQHDPLIELKLERKTYTLSITVLDEAKRNPIIGAKVFFKNRPENTGRNGKVSFSDLTDTGLLKIRVSQKGYENKTETFQTSNFDDIDEVVYLKKNKSKTNPNPPKVNSDSSRDPFEKLPYVLLGLVLFLLGVWLTTEYTSGKPFGMFAQDAVDTSNNPIDSLETDGKDSTKTNDSVNQGGDSAAGDSADQKMSGAEVSDEEKKPVKEENKTQPNKVVVLNNKEAIDEFSQSNIDITKLAECKSYLDNIESTFPNETKMPKDVKDIRGRLRQYEYVLNLIKKHQDSFNEKAIERYKKAETPYKDRHKAMIKDCSTNENAKVNEILNIAELSKVQRDKATEQIKSVREGVEGLDPIRFRD